MWLWCELEKCYRNGFLDALDPLISQIEPKYTKFHRTQLLPEEAEFGHDGQIFHIISERINKTYNPSESLSLRGYLLSLQSNIDRLEPLERNIDQIISPKNIYMF